MEKGAIDIAETLARLSTATIFELRGEWRRLHRARPPMRLSRDTALWIFTCLTPRQPPLQRSTSDGPKMGQRDNLPLCPQEVAILRLWYRTIVMEGPDLRLPDAAPTPTPTLDI
jgi:hypothetical protein